MGYLDCPKFERDESVVIDDKDVVFINTNYKKEFIKWCCEKED